jgi:glycosyltransferase involved in cell wall biosynthesis
MKVLIFDSGESGFGGSFKSCYLIAKSLIKSGYSPVVVAINDSYYWDKLRSEGIKVNIIRHIFYSKNVKYNFFEKIIRKIYYIFRNNRSISIFLFLFNRIIHLDFISQIIKIIKNEKIGIVHTNLNFFKDIPVYKIAANLKLPVICHLRTMPKRKLNYFEKKLINYKHSLFIAISKAVKEEWIKIGLPCSKIRLIYNAQSKIDFEKCDNKEIFRKNNSTVYLLFVGRLTLEKGISLLIEALSHIKDSNWILSVVGKGPERKNLEEFAKKKGLSERIIFYGFREDVDNFYRHHDIVILPSLNEPFGRVIIEAMSHGKAVIASNNGGVPEIIEDGKDGMVFETGDPRGLSESIKCLMNNHKKRTRLGIMGQKKISNKFAENSFNRELLYIYRNMIKDNN